MSWFLQKLDAFLAAAVIAAAAIAASQSQAFTAQYLSRASQQLAEARAHLEDVQSGLRYRVMGDTVRAELETAANARVAALARAYGKVQKRSTVLQPFMLLRYADHEVAAATRAAFVPTLPRSAGAIVFTVFGMICGFVVYELIKLPIMIFAREPRRRRFRKRG